MSIRVHDLAKHCGLSNKEMIAKLQSMKYPVKSHSSTVDKITAESIEKEYGYAPPAPVAPAPPPPPEPVREATLPPPVAPPAPVAVAATPPVHAPVASPKPAPAVRTPTAPAPKPVTPAVRLITPPAVRIAAPPVIPRATPAPVVVHDIVLDEQGHKVIQMKPPVTVRDLAQRIGVKSHVFLAQLMEMNIFANLNETVGEDTARKICERHGFKFQLEKRGIVHAAPKQPAAPPVSEKAAELKHRPPVVTVMGHVDHGKTSLLDAIRKTDVAAGETGGITQHIGAYTVQVPSPHKEEKGQLRAVTFLDTPGHEAFTKMRARGANVTDVVVLVVGADDGVMPQTVEAVNHAKAAGVTIIIAINKCDLPAANPDRVRRQLQELGLNPEDWGGDVPTVNVSARTKLGLDSLLETILLHAELMDLKADYRAAASGSVVEAQIEPGRGSTATVLVRRGTLRSGDAIICGPHWAKIRALFDDKGQRVKEATPSIPVKIIGLSGCPEPGEEFAVMKNEKDVRALAEQRQQASRLQAAGPAAPRVTLEDLMAQGEEGKKKVLRIVLKADVQGSLQAIGDSLGKIKSDKVDLELIHGAVGNITENDVLLASASGAIIIGFRVKPETSVTDIAKGENVQIKLYSIIYELLEQVEEAMLGLLEPEARETITGHAEVRQIFQLTKGPMVAGCVVTDGRLARTGRVRLLRRKAVHYEGKFASLRHFQDDVKEVKAGLECGLRLENFAEFQVGDIIECYTVEKTAAKL